MLDSCEMLRETLDRRRRWVPGGSGWDGDPVAAVAIPGDPGCCNGCNLEVPVVLVVVN